MEFLEAATNATSASLCLAVPSFFSGNIFYCYLGLAPAVAVAVAVAAVAAFPPSSPALSLPPPWSFVPSFSYTLSSTPLRTVPTNTSLETLHYITQHNSTLLTLLETLLYVSVSFLLLLFLS